MASWGDAWDIIDQACYIPPSREVFTFGLAKAAVYMRRHVSSTEFAAWLVAWADSSPEDMEEAP